MIHKKLNTLTILLAQSQLKSPWKYLISTLIITIISGYLASLLVFDSTYEALLPTDSPQIRNSDEVREKTGGTRQLIIALSGKDTDKRIEFARKVLPSIQSLQGIKAADLEFPVEFFKERALWLAEPETLDKLIPALEEAVRLEKIRAHPFALNLDEEAQNKEIKEAWKKVKEISNPEDLELPFKKILTSKDGKYTFIVVIPSIKFTDMNSGQELLNGIKANIQKAKPETYGVDVAYAGSLEVLSEQHSTMQNDMIRASAIAIIFGILIISVFTRRLLAPAIIAASLLAGVSWTFAFASLYIGNVNIITGFLVAVLIGLGIDFGIHLFVRFQQEIFSLNTSFEKAFETFVTETAQPATTSAITTAAVFFTFTIAEFRGFSEFGLIAGVGVFMTLLSTFLILPPLLLLIYKNKAKACLTSKKQEKSLKKNLPLPIATTIVLLLTLIAGTGVWALSQLSFENDFRKLRGYSEATEFFDYVNENLGAGFNPSIFLVNTIEEAKEVKILLSSLMEKEKDSKSPTKIGKIISASDLVPGKLEEKTKRIKKLDEILWDKALNRALEQDTEEAAQLKEARDMVRTSPWSFDELPKQFKQRFVTVDEQNPQYMVYVWPSQHHDIDYLAAKWEDKLENISEKLNQKKISHQKADETLILAWVYRLVKKDAIPLMAFASIIVLFFLFLDFKNLKDVALLATTLLTAMLGFIAIAHLLGMEINMFNIIVFPSVIGIGIDNAIHILHRYKKEGPGSIMLVMKKTGSAALLASATTAAGFGSSIVAHNQGLVSLGQMAMLGISFSFIAAVFFLPSLISLFERIKSSKK